MSDDEILSGFTSLRDAIQRGFARLEQRMHHIERRLDRVESRLLAMEAPARAERQRERRLVS